MAAFKSKSEISTQTNKDSFERPDGRKIDELRPMKAKVGIIPNADGSAMFACTHNILKILKKEH